MKLKFLTRKVSSAIAASCLLGAASHSVFATPIELTFDEIKESVPKILATPRAHFVRLELVPLSVWESEQKAIGTIVDRKSRDEYAAKLKAKLVDKIAAFEAAGYVSSNSSFISDVGFTVFATDEQIRSMKGTEGVSKIIAKQSFLPQRDYSTSWVGGTVAHSSGYTGEGQVVAIIDTGVDYIHRDFGGSGDYTENDPTLIEEGSFPTNRVIGGYDLVGFDYDASNPESNTPQPDVDPFDDGRHGTHVAGIAAGNGIEGILGEGIAPGASIMALKVFGANGSTNLTADAIEIAMDPNGDGDTSDAVDVINMSLGAQFGDPADPTSVAAQNASDSGIVVVASAGNSGNDIPYVSGSPGSARDVITVASTLSGGVPAFFLPFLSDSGEAYEFFAQYAAISPALESDIVGDLSIADPYDACTPLTSSLSEKIALITRGACAFTTKLQNAVDAGAIAAVVVNNVPGPAIVMGGSDVALAGAMISLEDGALILAELGDSNVVGTELADANVKPFTDDDNTMSGFSSRGPGPTGEFKPDVSAPGSSIVSAASGSGEGTLALSGTSMAAPQVAGMAAILREKFPELNSAAIKAIIQNTATPASDPNSVTGTPPLSLQGTGVINIEKALAATSYVSPGGIGFGRVNPEYNESITRYITITNFSGSGKRYSISQEPNLVLPQGASSLSINSEVYIGAGQSQRIPVILNLHANAMVASEALSEMDGWFVVKSGEERMRVGYQAIIDPASRLNFSNQGDAVDIRNDAFGDASVFGYTFVNSTGSDDSVELVGDLGFRMTSDVSVAFGLNANAGWTNFSRKRLSIMIDTDGDDAFDYQADIADLQFFNGDNDPTGTLVSGILDLNDPEASVQLLYLANADLNNSVVQFQLDAFGDFGFLTDSDTTFSYEMIMTDRYNGDVNGMQTGVVDLSSNVTFDVPASLVPAQESVRVQVTGGEQTLWLSPTESKTSRRAVIR